MVLSYSFYFYTSWNMVMIAILKSLLDMKHLGNLRVGILIVFFIREFFRLSWFFLYQVNFSAYRRHLEYYMLWDSGSYSNIWRILHFGFGLFALPDNWPGKGQVANCYLLFVHCGFNVSSVFKVSVVIFELYYVCISRGQSVYPTVKFLKLWYAV